MISEIAAVTLSVRDMDGTLRALVEGLGFDVERSWDLGDENDRDLARLWQLPSPPRGRAHFLRQGGAPFGAIRLVSIEGNGPTLTEDARPYDYGYVKNLDFFTDDVASVCARLKNVGVEFMSSPVDYALPWGGVKVTEAHTRPKEGFKFAVAKLHGAPRKAMGESPHGKPCTEVAAATQIVADCARASSFYEQVFDCVPSAETVVADPGLAEALHLPKDTALRMCFIGRGGAVAGKIGLVAYEGPGVSDKRAVPRGSMPPCRGAVALSFETDELDSRHARALARGASEVSVPAEGALLPWGRVRASSFLSPDRVLHELIERREEPLWIPVLASTELSEGQMRGVSNVGHPGRVLVIRAQQRVLAWRDQCPHLDGPLSRGLCEGSFVVCPWHGWRIDLLTGRVEGGLGLSVASVPARERKGWIEIGSPRARQA